MVDDEKPRPDNAYRPPELSGWSVAELRDHIKALREDIVRAEAVIAARESSQNAAAAFFKLPKGAAGE